MSRKLQSEVKRYIFPYILKSLKDSAHNLVEAKDPTVVGVTGSTGKSSYIYLLDSVMREHMKTKTTFHGNSETGLPLEILGIRNLLTNYSLMNWLAVLAATPFAYLWGKLKFDYELLIAEMGIDSSKPPKNMEYLLEIITPDIGVFLTVAAVHAEQFAEELHLGMDDADSIIRAIAQEKGKIVTSLGDKSHAIINIDNPYIQELVPDIHAQIVTFGSSSEADFQLVSSHISSESSSFTFRIDNDKYNIVIDGYLLSHEYGYTLGAVIATAVTLGLNLDHVIRTIETKFNIPPGRMSLVQGEKGITILDSSYNSSPFALEGILKSVQKLEINGRKVLVLGDMRELGPIAPSEHQKFADMITEIAQTVVLVGPLMKQYLAPSLTHKGVEVFTFDTSQGVGHWMLSEGIVSQGDFVLVKGSQNTIFLEQVVFELMKDKDKAQAVLCRQSEHWDKTRQKFFLNANSPR